MCTFLSSLPRKSKVNGTDKKPSLVLSLKPCPDQNSEKTWYRLRLLAFNSPSKNDRDYPFIQRYVHQHWGKNSKGFSVVEDEVVCPVTKWMPWEGDRYDCPICKVANQQFVALKESNWRNADARAKNREFSRKYEAIIPVYVKEDPNYPGNNGKFKVLIFNDRKQYEEFEEKIKQASTRACVFNGANAVDCCIHMSLVPEVRNEGQPNQYTYNKKVIDKITFSNKPYDIPAITKETVDAFPFDDTYYVSSTKDEIMAFYNKYIKVSNDDIVDDEDDVKVYDAPKQEPVKKITPPTPGVTKTALENEAPTAVVDDLTTDIDDLDASLDLDPTPAPAPAATPKQAEVSDDDKSVDDLLDGLDLD